jgi:hypothetical protein
VSFDRLDELIRARFEKLTLPVVHNLSLLVESFFRLTAGLRSGNGALTLAAIARGLPLTTNFRDRYKRLNRFLDNQVFDPSGLTDGLCRVIFGNSGKPTTVPVIVDQSTIGSVELLLAGIPIFGRVLPLSLLTFTYEQIQDEPLRTKSRNHIENVFFLDLLASAPAWLGICFILDRGYARVSLMLELLSQPKARFIFRVPRNVIVERTKSGKRHRCRVGDLRSKHGQPTRFERVFYRSHKPIEVDLVVFYESGNKEPWYMVVPPGSAEWFSNEEVVSLYRRRMHIEQGFRDFKTHLGIRGLRLEVRISERTGRVLMAFALAYAIVVVLGATAIGEKSREAFEQLRRKPRHGTRRILSTRTIGAHLLSCLQSQFLRETIETLDQLIADILRGKGIYPIALRL